MKVRLVKRQKGYELRHEDDYWIASLSAMDAAELLFQVKDELRRTALGRGCVDKVAASRLPSTRAFSAEDDALARNRDGKR